MEIQVTRCGEGSSAQGPAEWFTGRVRVDMLFQPQEAARTSGGSVTFEPGARTAWHVHPLGQVLVVTAGSGLVQRWGGVVNVIKAGDVVWIPAGVKHWHGASAHAAMTHLAIQESLEGKAVDWLEHVADEQYLVAGRG